MTDLAKAYDMIVAKNKLYDDLFKYADGDQPLKYSTVRLQEAFRDMDTKFSMNWISVVLDSCLDRISFQGWATKDTTAKDILDSVFEDNKLAIDSYDAHKTALITHEAYIIAWQEEEEIEVYYNDPRNVHLFYKAYNPKKKDFGAKLYQDGDVYRMILYYPDRLEYYETAPTKSLPASANAFHSSEVAVSDNLYGEVPVFHIAINKRTGVSELTNIVTLQDAVNKLLSDMMVAAEFGAYKQRYIITNADTKALVNKPNVIWEIPPADGGTQPVSVGEFAEANLDNFLNAIDKLANAIAVISRTPKHYFYQSGSNVSGEALMAMESPLVAKAEQYIKNFSTAWRELGAFVLKLYGIEVPETEINPIWEPVQSVQPLTEAQTIKTHIDSGIPLETVLRWAGKDQDEIDQIMKLVNDKKKQDANEAKIMLDTLRLQQEHNNGIEDTEPEE